MKYNTIVLTEKYNQEILDKIKKKINSVPTSNGLETLGETTNKWQLLCRDALTKYGKSRVGVHRVEYIQDPKMLGRYRAKNNLGLHMIPRKVRGLICHEYYVDVDISCCHHQFIANLLNKYDLKMPKALSMYLESKDDFEQEYSLDKESFIKLINTEKCNHKNEDIREFHRILYTKLYPILQETNAEYYKILKKHYASVSFNVNGKIMSWFLQNIENNVLQCMISYIEENTKFVTGVLCFDGFMLEKHEDINEDLLRNIEEEVLISTGHKIVLKFKELDTTWDYINAEDTIYNNPNAIYLKEEVYDKEINKMLYNDSFYIDETTGKKIVLESNLQLFVEYINKFACIITKPVSYGWRISTKQPFDLNKKDRVKDMILYGFDDNSNPDISWRHHKNSSTYHGVEFCVDETKANPNYFNIYIRPAYKINKDATLEEICPEFHDFLYRIISSSDIRIYNYLINYISKKTQVGKAAQLIALLGEKGCGKSTFAELLALIFGEEYYQKVDDIHQINSNFNSLYETTILTSVEEVVSNAGDYHQLQSKLKTLTTESRIKIEKKGIDSYMSNSQNDYIVITNENNPIKVTEDNRRYLILTILAIERNNYKYFSNLKKSFSEQLEYIRGFFFTYNYIDNLNGIRPFTDAEDNLLQLNESSVVSFIKDREFNNIHEMSYTEVYNKYTYYCSQYKYKSMSSKYFKLELKKYNYEIEINPDGEYIVNDIIFRDFISSTEITEKLLYKDYYDMYEHFCNSRGFKPLTKKFFSLYISNNGLKTFKQGRNNNTYVSKV